MLFWESPQATRSRHSPLKSKWCLQVMHLDMLSLQEGKCPAFTLVTLWLPPSS